MTQQDDITQRVRDNETNIASAAKEWATPENVLAFPMTACAHIAGLADALLSKLRAPVADTYVEARECGACGHVGINDSSDTQAACKNCDWSGDSPKEDHCPGCAQNGTMTAACPECGGQYGLLADRTISAALASAPVAGKVVAHAVLAYGRIQRVVVNEESAHEYAEQQRLNAEAAGWDAKAHTRPLVYGDAAPQASECECSRKSKAVSDSEAQL